MSTGIFGIIKGVAATITFLFLVDRFGRRSLFFVGSVMCAFSMFYLAGFSSLTKSFEADTSSPDALAYSAAAFIYVFGAGYVSFPRRMAASFSCSVMLIPLTQAIEWNLPWIVAAEIYPTKVRSFCVMLTTCSHWLGQFYMSYAVGYMLRDITYGTFLFFGVMTVLGALYVWFFLPETQGVSLEDMDALFASKGTARRKIKLYAEHRAAQQMFGEDGSAKADGAKADQVSVA